MGKIQAQLELDNIYALEIEIENGLHEQIYEYEEARAEYEFEMAAENAWLREAEYDAQAQHELNNIVWY